MGLDLLDTPVRLTWDFPDYMSGTDRKPGPGSATCAAAENERRADSLSAIATRIADGGVFFVTLQGSPLLNPGLAEVLLSLDGRCQLMVSCRGSADELLRLPLVAKAGCQLLLDVSSFMDLEHGLDTVGLRDVIRSIRQQSHEPILCLTPLRNNLFNIPDLMRFCCEHKIAKLKLPNAHIGDSFHGYTTEDLPRWQDLDDFREIWQDFTKTPCQMPSLEIHDLFLWEIMTPGQQQNRAEYGGCQAGNSLGHVDGDGVVHPCAAWPQPLGILPGQSLEEIWADSARISVREQIAQVAAGCEGCRDLDICYGGCRGLANLLNRSEGGRDLMCSGPR